MASATDASQGNTVAPSPPSSSLTHVEDVAKNAVGVEGERKKTIASLASLDAAFAEVSTSQSSALEALDGLMRELAACEEAASIPGTLSPALEAAAALRARVRRASRKLQRASRRAARAEAAVAEIRRRRRQHGAEEEEEEEEQSDPSSLSS